MKFCTLIILCLCLLLPVSVGASVQNFEGAVLVRNPQVANADDTTLMLEDEGENIYSIAVSGFNSPEFIWTNLSGQKLAQYTITDFVSKFVFRGGSYFMFCDAWYETIVKEIDTDTGELLQSFSINAGVNNLTHISADYLGNSYSVNSSSPNTVNKIDSEGSEDIVFSSSVNYMEVYGESLYVYQNNTLSIISVEDFSIDSAISISASAVPQNMISDSLYLGVDNFIYKIENQIATKIDSVQVKDGLDDGMKRASVTHDDVILWKSTNAALSAYKDGANENISISFPGNIVSLGQTGVFYMYEHSIYYIQYSRLDIDMEDEDDEDETGDDFNGYEIRANYIEVPYSQLVSKFIENTNAQVLDFEGDPVTSGVCETGYKVIAKGLEYEMVVSGDINSTGTINSSDVKLMMEHIITLNQLQGARYQAADVNKDNIISVMDLHLLIKLLD